MLRSLSKRFGFGGGGKDKPARAKSPTQRKRRGRRGSRSSPSGGTKRGGRSASGSRRGGGRRGSTSRERRGSTSGGRRGSASRERRGSTSRRHSRDRGAQQTQAPRSAPLRAVAEPEPVDDDVAPGPRALPSSRSSQPSQLTSPTSHASSAGTAGSTGACAGWLHIQVVSGRNMPNLDVLRAMDPYVVAWVEPFRNYGAPRTKSFRKKVASLVQLPYRRARGAWKGGDQEEPPRNYDRTNTLVNRGGNPVWSEADGDKAHLKVWVEDTVDEVSRGLRGCKTAENCPPHCRFCTPSPALLRPGALSGSMG